MGRPRTNILDIYIRLLVLGFFGLLTYGVELVLKSSWKKDIIKVPLFRVNELLWDKSIHL